MPDARSDEPAISAWILVAILSGAVSGAARIIATQRGRVDLSNQTAAHHQQQAQGLTKRLSGELSRGVGPGQAR